MPTLYDLPEPSRDEGKRSNDGNSQAREPWNLGHIGLAVALWAAFLVVFWRLLGSWDDITGATRNCTGPSGSANWWVPGVLGLLAGAGTYAFITPPYKPRYIMWSVLLTLILGGGIYLCAAAIGIDRCME